MTIQYEYKTLNVDLNLEERAMPIWQLRALRLGLIRCCVNCDHFELATEGCRLANNARPPAVVITLGCDKWNEELPF